MKKKRVLLTGGYGFLGKHVFRELTKQDWVDDVHLFRSRELDLRNFHKTDLAFSICRPDLVIHLAAKVGGILENKNHPGEFFYDNMLMGMNVIEAARKNQVEKTVLIGTVCSYPKFADIPFKESDLWHGYPEETNAPYGIAKKALTEMGKAYQTQYGNQYITVIPVNLYGPGDNFDLMSSHVIPAMIRKFESARRNGLASVDLWGDGTPTREFLYVEDAARGIVLAAEKYDLSYPVNLGTGVEISIRRLGELIAKKVGYTGRIEWLPGMPNGQPRRRLEVSKAKQYFAFEAQIDFSEGLEKTIAWFRENLV